MGAIYDERSVVEQAVKLQNGVDKTLLFVIHCCHSSPCEGHNTVTGILHDRSTETRRKHPTTALADVQQERILFEVSNRSLYRSNLATGTISQVRRDRQDEVGGQRTSERLRKQLLLVSFSAPLFSPLMSFVSWKTNRWKHRWRGRLVWVSLLESYSWLLRLSMATDWHPLRSVGHVSCKDLVMISCPSDFLSFMGQRESLYYQMHRHHEVVLAS